MPRPPSAAQGGSSLPQPMGTPGNSATGAAGVDASTPSTAHTPLAMMNLAGNLPTPSAPTPTFVGASPSTSNPPFAGINAGTPSASTPIAATPTFRKTSTPAAQAAYTPNVVSSNIAPSPAAGSLAAPSPSMQTPAAPSPAQSIAGSSSTPLRINKRTGAATPLPAPIDTSRAPGPATENVSETPLSARKRKLEESEVALTPKLEEMDKSSKRARYKVEYKPIHVPMTHMAGWDERAVRSTFPMNNLAHPSRSIHDLEVVDMEAVLMGLRSRLPRELGYCLTVLSMLSMPHPEDGLDGLPLVHLSEIFIELLLLLEEAAFGEDGYDHWQMRMDKGEDVPEWDISDLDFMDFERIARHEDVSLPADPVGKDKWRKSKTGGSTDIVLSTINLLRNFSMFEENREFMGRRPHLFATLSRIVDPRLVRVPGRCSPEQAYSMSEYATVCRDTIMILTNVGYRINLSVMPPACVRSIFRLLSRTMSSGFDISLFKESPYGNSAEPNQAASLPSRLTTYRAAEAFYSLAAPDTNREALGKVPEEELVALFVSLIKLLPVTQRHTESLYHSEAHLVYTECISLALYSLSFLSPLSARAAMRAVPGAVEILRRLIMMTMTSKPTFQINPFASLCGRLAETLGVLNGTQTCGGEIGASNMGFSAGAGDGKGWKWSSGTIVSGWMASQSERIQECLMVPLVDGHAFSELDALWWATDE